MGDVTIIHGDCLDVLRGMPDNSVDSVVTDPPYGLAFMGKKWDYDVPDVEVWSQCLRVLKPGGHLLAFAGTRTQHRMAVRIEDAGFEIRDMIAWVYGSGFPKSHNLGGEWSGWGTALKPALEPITVARKPFASTVAANVTQWGTGAINVDGCRVGTTDTYAYPNGAGGSSFTVGGGIDGTRVDTPTMPLGGRWPANLIHDGSDEVVGGFPNSGNGQEKPTVAKRQRNKGWCNSSPGEGVDAIDNYGDSGSAARFFYCAKASKAERDAGCEGLEVGHPVGGADKWTEQDRRRGDGVTRQPSRNVHPTVKPAALMAYLCRLVTPPGGTILDPFAGSGSTGIGASRGGFKFIGIEKESEYVEIANRRIAHVVSGGS